MSFDTEAKAQTHAQEVLEILGAGWTLRVWNNIGWHCAWQNGAIHLHYEPSGSYYHVLIGRVGDYGGHMDLSSDNRSTDPKEAIRSAIQEAQRVFREVWRPIQDSVAMVGLAMMEQPAIAYRKYSSQRSCDDICEMLMDYPDTDSIVVYGSNTSLLSQLYRYMWYERDRADVDILTPAHGVAEINKVLEYFQDGKVKLLFLDIGAFSTGITLTKANRMVFLDEQPDDKRTKQAIGRTHRIGRDSAEPLAVTHFDKETN